VSDAELTVEVPEMEEISDGDVDEAIALCGGDLRKTVKALLIANAFTEQMLELSRQEASQGFLRRRPKRAKG
jgi:hypothetical protein